MKLGELKGKDLLEYLTLVENTLLDLRSNLNLDKDLTFGIEIEYEGLSKRITDNFIDDKMEEWSSKRDGSLKFGGEITSPIMTDEEKYYKELKMVCDFLNKHKVDTSKNAGGHIHIGANILEDNKTYWKNFLKIYSVYESVIFRFAYGDKLSARSGLKKYAKPVSNLLLGAIKNLEEHDYGNNIRLYIPAYEKYQAVNFRNVSENAKFKDTKNTIEFRSPNGCSNEVVWQNNINVFAKILMTSKKNIDTEYLDYKLKNEFINPDKDEYLYNMVNLKLAIEFCDFIFSDDIDKLYFLRQYLKDFDEVYNGKSTIKARRFYR